jgi:hypothetical protein
MNNEKKELTLNKDQKELVKELMSLCVNHGYYIQAYEMNRDENVTCEIAAKGYLDTARSYKKKAIVIEQKLGFNEVEDDRNK